MGGRGSSSRGGGAGKAAQANGGVAKFTDDVMTRWITEPGFATDVRSGKHPDVEKGMEEYIASQPSVSGTLYRGIELTNDMDMSKFQVGSVVDMNGISSWSTYRDVAMDYSMFTGDSTTGVVFKTNGTRKGAKLGLSGEGEVIISKSAKWKVTGVQDDGDSTYTVTLMAVTP